MSRWIGFFILSILSTAVFAINDANLPDVVIGQPGKKKGDMISPSTRLQIAAWCDFSKQIITVSGVYLCVFNGSTAGQLPGQGPLPGP